VKRAIEVSPVFSMLGVLIPGLKTLGYFLSPLAGRAADDRDELDKVYCFLPDH
jgi:hypothetical protein